jgi:hypothetical protein
MCNYAVLGTDGVVKQPTLADIRDVTIFATTALRISTVEQVRTMRHIDIQEYLENACSFSYSCFQHALLQ